MSDRAARRRAEREKKAWTPFNQETDQTLPPVAWRINQHNMTCERCRSGNVVKRGCPGLDKLYLANSDEIHEMLGFVPESEEDAASIEE